MCCWRIHCVLPEITSLTMAVLDVPSVISAIATATLSRNGPSVNDPSVVLTLDIQVLLPMLTT